MQAEMCSPLPDRIETEEALDELLTRPGPELIEAIRSVRSPLVVLGGAGKMGPGLAVQARRAADLAGHPLEVVVVSRFSDPEIRHWLDLRGVRTLKCDLLEREALKRLPDSENVVYMVGLKFGTAANPSLTWVMNTLAPANVGERYPGARVAVLSTGNVYPLTPVKSGGAVEGDSLTPLGEYANAAVARERLFQYFCLRNSMPIVIVRLNYAVELRYGVLVDIASKVLAGRPVNVANGHLNCIWQGDANEFILRMLGQTSVPPTIFNLTGPHTLSVRELALEFGRLMDRPVQFEGAEAETALLNNAARTFALLGQPPTPLERVMRWTADWVLSGRRLLQKPTHFEVRDGKY